ncbi:hypothetical protein [Viridibacillus arvi]|nr:hypothetical protein [Viridibacillus sp. JNUCC-6]QOV11776.1 hypothetical protein JNUCC6_03085 [Viridibacillus sp. JNUCC-6]
MEVIGIVIICAVFAVFEAVRRLNNNVLEQTEEIKKLRDELKEYNKQP